MRTKGMFVLFLVLAMLAASGCVPQKANTREEARVLKVGAAISMTGRLAKEGQLLKDGYDFWKDYVNSKGGMEIGGKKYIVEIKYYDDRSDAQTSAKLVERLITEDGIKIIFGPYGSGMTQATAPIGEKYGAITIASMANADSIYEQGFKNVFGILPPATRNLQSIINMANTFDPKPKTVAIMTPDDLFPRYGAEGAKARAEELGFTVSYYAKYPKGTSDLSPMLTELRKSKPDMIVTSADLEEAVLLIRQLKEAKLSPKIIGTINAQMPDFVKVLGKDAEYIYGSVWWAPNMTWKDPLFGSTTNYSKMFEEKYKYAPNYYNAAGSAAGVALMQAMIKAGSTEVAAVKKALSEIEIETFFGPLKFDSKGRNALGTSSAIQIQDGKVVVVYPERIREAKPRYPAPPWEDR